MTTTHHPAAGAELSATKWRAQRIAEVTAPERVEAYFAKALGRIEQMDECDSDLRNLGLVIVDCMRAVVIALDPRT